MPSYTYYSTTTTGGYSVTYNFNMAPHNYYLNYHTVNSRLVFSQKELNTVLKAFAEDDYTWLDGSEITEDTYPDYFDGAYITVFSDKTITVL